MQGFARDPELSLCKQVGYGAALWVNTKVAQTPSPGIVDRFGLDAFARAVSHQLNSLVVRHINGGRFGTQLRDCVHLPFNSLCMPKLRPRPLRASRRPAQSRECR